MDIYEKNSKFDESQRMLLIKTIAQYYDDNAMQLSLRGSYEMEKQIDERFPSEKIVSTYN